MYILQFIFIAGGVLNKVCSAKDEEACHLRTFTKGSECSGIQSYQPWPTDEICKEYMVELGQEGTWKPTALASFGTSGSSWVRKMIQRSTGIVVGSGQVTSPGFRSTLEDQIRCGVRPWDGKTIIQDFRIGKYNLLPKWLRNSMNYEGEEFSWPVLFRVFYQYRGVLLIRNPWHAIISSRISIQTHIRKCCTRNFTQNVKIETRDFEESRLQKYMIEGANEWVDHIITWVKGIPDVSNLLIVKYENLEANPEQELKRILKYLNVSIDEERLKCVLIDSRVYHDPIPTKKIKSIVSRVFDHNTQIETIIQEGLGEINKIFELREINEKLDYKKPSYSDLLNNVVMFISRAEVYGPEGIP